MTWNKLDNSLMKLCLKYKTFKYKPICYNLKLKKIEKLSEIINIIDKEHNIFYEIWQNGYIRVRQVWIYNKKWLISENYTSIVSNKKYKQIFEIMKNIIE